MTRICGRKSGTVKPAEEEAVTLGYKNNEGDGGAVSRGEEHNAFRDVSVPSYLGYSICPQDLPNQMQVAPKIVFIKILVYILFYGIWENFKFCFPFFLYPSRSIRLLFELKT